MILGSFRQLIHGFVDDDFGLFAIFDRNVVYDVDEGWQQLTRLCRILQVETATYGACWCVQNRGKAFSRCSMYVPTRTARQTLGVSANTLRRWADTGAIDCVRAAGQKRLYNVHSVRPVVVETTDEKENQKGSTVTTSSICYCRVSSGGQRDDLDRQIQFMRDRFPDHEIISDVASGLNFKRRGLRKLLDRAFSGTIEEVVVAHKDRLCRFGFELLSWILEKHRVRLVVLEQTMDTPQGELAEDLLSIIHVFSCRVNGRRKYTGKAGRRDTSSAAEDDAGIDGRSDVEILDRSVSKDLQHGSRRRERTESPEEQDDELDVVT
jgi:predicted site-specific integrase-resolvase